MGSRNMSELPWSQWHPTKNGDLTPDDVTDGSNKRVWWVCDLGHEWQTATYYRVAKSSQCPYCVGQKVLAGFNDLATKFPDVARQWHPTKNKPLEPFEIGAGSEKKIWWLCDLGHEWEANLSNRTRVGSGCPVCDGKQVLAGFNDLASKFPDVAAEWSSRNELSASEVISGSGKSVWWACSEGHEWEQRISVRTSQAVKCPVCANQKIVAGINDLQTLEPQIARQWHPTKNGDLLPSQVSVGSHKKSWWLCVEGHEWEAAISSRRRNGCPVCGNRQVVVGINDLSTTHPEIATEWHPTKNGDLSPTQVALGQTKSLWWKCSEGHEWKATLDTRNRSGCPRCAKYGFDQGGESEIYFIENQELKAWKIGITGTDRVYDRLASYQRLGWTVIVRTSATGRVVMAAEKAMFNWIRKELELPQYLEQDTMGKHGGATETFALVEELKEEILDRLAIEIKKATEAEG